MVDSLSVRYHLTKKLLNAYNVPHTVPSAADRAMLRFIIQILQILLHRHHLNKISGRKSMSRLEEQDCIVVYIYNLIHNRAQCTQTVASSQMP